ncbi:MAG: ribose 5-phosphate isomerase A [Chryseobacterium sp.]|nr:MAG: ribose 5-phosphate isomerase A [Chryseobacterium sp.]
MEDYKLNAARAALQFIKPNQKIGLGAGSTIFHLIDQILEDALLAKSLTYLSPSVKTRKYLRDLGLSTQLRADVKELDIYIDSCDQLDEKLNAFKSGAGIHSGEKIMAAIAKTFILMADVSKLVENLTNRHPLVLEILPNSLPLIFQRIKQYYPDASVSVRMSVKKDVPLMTENSNLLVDINFVHLPEIEELDRKIKMIPGVLDHSLFYRIANKGIIAGPNGIKIINQQSLHHHAI